MINTHLLFLIVISLLNVLLGFLVWLNNKKNIGNRAFGIFIFFVVLWTIILYISDLPSQASNALFWNKLTLSFGILFASTFAYFCLVFIEKEGFSIFLRRPLSFIVLSSILFLFLVTLFTNLVVKKIEFYEWGTNIVTGSLYFLVAGYYFCASGVGLGSLISKHKKSTGIEKKQVQFLFFGFLLSAVGILTTNLILPLITGENPFAKYGPYFITFFIVFTAYAITKHHLFDIKVIATEILVGLLGGILIVDLATAESATLRLFKLAVFIAFLYLGVSLVRSVLEEIKRREELESLTEKLEIANNELRKLDRAKSEFISMASHQLRTPLSTIKGYVSMMIEGSWGELKAKQKEKLENVFESNERLIKLVADLMDISKIELGKMTMEKNMVQIEETVESCCSELKDIAEKKGLKLYFEKSEEPLPQIEVDNFKIRQAILNVLDNAIKYTRSGEIKISARQKDGKIIISIKDTGEGLRDEEKTSIFSGFVRGSAGINLFTEGTGIGLHVAKKFLEMHKGKIWAESEGEGKGSTFFIELPVGK